MPEYDRTAEWWAERLQMSPHPEGGWYKELYRSAESIPEEGLPDRFKGGRSFSTGIYFLITSESFSAFHRLKADEGWHFYAGSSLLLHQIDPQGHLQTIGLGPNPEKDQGFQAWVEAGNWFAAEVAEKEAYALVGCTMAPGFDFEDFELARAMDLSKQFPQHRSLIERLTRS